MRLSKVIQKLGIWHKRLRKFFHLERATLVQAQGTSEDKKFAALPMPSKSTLNHFRYSVQLRGNRVRDNFNYLFDIVIDRGISILAI
jgi:hypothetical protein